MYLGFKVNGQPWVPALWRMVNPALSYNYRANSLPLHVFVLTTPIKFLRILIRDGSLEPHPSASRAEGYSLE
jgi:hypothetical protein